MGDQVIVAGADISKGRWAVVVLRDGQFDRASRVDRLADILEKGPDIAMLAVDIPIGLPAGDGDWPRSADVAAKEFLGKAGASVFHAPPRPVLDCESYDEANRLHRKLTGKGLTQQAWGLRNGILQAEALAEKDDRIIEVHPEVSFLEHGRQPADRFEEDLERSDAAAVAACSAGDHHP